MWGGIAFLELQSITLTQGCFYGACSGFGLALVLVVVGGIWISWLRLILRIGLIGVFSDVLFNEYVTGMMCIDLDHTIERPSRYILSEQ